MAVECLAIIILILVMSYIYLRSGKPSFSLAILPLIFVPVMYLLSFPISQLINSMFGVNESLTSIFMILLGAVSACCIFGFLSSKIKKKSFNTAYNILCTGFTVTFAWIIVLSIIKPILL